MISLKYPKSKFSQNTTNLLSIKVARKFLHDMVEK